MLSESQRSLRARIAAHSLHAQRDSRELTRSARKSFRDKFEREADPEGVLDPEERQRRAQQLRKAFYVRLALASSKARSKKRSRPRGGWVGLAGWHETEVVTAPSGSTEPEPGERVEVDELLAPLLFELWRLGFPTSASCQNAPDENDEESGEAHINFATTSAAKQFAGIVGRDAIVYRPDTGRQSRETSVAFPTERIPELLASIKRKPAA